MKDFRSFIEAVREASDIVDVVGKDMLLERSGRTLKGLSPFRKEKTPSFCVWPESGRWRDFSGGSEDGGDVFSYVERKENVGFKEAVFLLAEKAGIQRPGQDDEAFRREVALLEERREVSRLLTLAAHYYHQVLPSRVRSELYLGHYGFENRTVDELELGYADGHLFEHFLELGVRPETALKTGLFVMTKTGVEDFFSDRLVFPYWKRGQAAYFIARKTQYTGDAAWERSKYKKLLTHSERHPYVSEALKNDTFWGEDSVRGAEEVLITEGITDAISAYEAGIACISPVTTRFRKDDLEKLVRLTRSCARVVICNDTDENGSGTKGAIETAKALHDAGRDVRVAVLPKPESTEKIDVNEFLKDQGKERFEAVLSTAPRYVEHLLRAVPEDTPPAELESRLRPALEALVATGKIERDGYLDAIVSRFGTRRRALSGALKAVDAELRAKTAALRQKEKTWPEVQVNGRQLRAVIEEARDIVVRANLARVEAGRRKLPSGDDLPLVFQRAGDIVRLWADERFGVELAPFSDTAMFGLLVRDADWIAIDEEGEERPAHPPKDVARDLVTFVPAGLPQVDTVITTPVFGKDGGLIDAPGLHADDYLWLHLDQRLRLGEIPKSPTKEDVRAALSLFFDELFVDFPFATESDRAHMLSAVLLPFARRLIQGNTPLHVVESPTIGSGKSLLCNLVAIVCTGSESEISTLPTQEEEVRKTLTAELMKGCPIVVLDNANERQVLSSQALTSVLTTIRWRNRVLGKSEIIVVPNYAMWMLTGNNPRMSGELTRRSVRIRIDPKQDRAWQRSGFKHDPITQWALEHRSELVRAALVLIRAWIAAGKPPPTDEKKLGSFESWVNVMGGILDVAGVPGFLSNADDMYDNADPDGEMWREFIAIWWDKFAEEPKRVSDLNDLCITDGLMLPVRGDGGERSQQVRLGRALLGARDRWFGELRIASEATRNRSRQYMLEQRSSAPSGTAANDPITLDTEAGREAESPVSVPSEIDPWE